VVLIWLGDPKPLDSRMSEVVLDLRDYISGEWPKSLLDTLPEEKVLKDYNVFEKDSDAFQAHTPTKNNPYFEWYTKYRLIDSGIK